MHSFSVIFANTAISHIVLKTRFSDYILDIMGLVATIFIELAFLSDGGTHSI